MTTQDARTLRYRQQARNMAHLDRLVTERPEPREAIHEARPLSDAEARTEILTLMADGQQRDSFDLAVALELDFDQSERVCEALFAEGVFKTKPKVFEDEP